MPPDDNPQNTKIRETDTEFFRMQMRPDIVRLNWQLTRAEDFLCQNFQVGVFFCGMNQIPHIQKSQLGTQLGIP